MKALNDVFIAGITDRERGVENQDWAAIRRKMNYFFMVKFKVRTDWTDYESVEKCRTNFFFNFLDESDKNVAFKHGHLSHRATSDFLCDK